MTVQARHDPISGIDLERQPPHDLAAEEAVLGAMLLSRDAVAEVLESGLRGTDFYRPPHETIFDVIVDMYGRGEAHDPIAVVGVLREAGELGRVGGGPRLQELAAALPSVPAVVMYAEIVMEQARRRRLVEVGTRLTQAAYSGQGKAMRIADGATQAIQDAVSTADTADLHLVGDLVQPTLDEFEAIAAHDGTMRGVPTGFADLDTMLNGLQPGQLVIAAARPAIGKSTFALDIARHAAVTHRHPTLLFSMEMGRVELVSRLLSAEAKVLLNRMRGGHLSDNDWDRIALVLGRLADAPLVIDDSAYLTIAQMLAKARRVQQRHGLRLIVVDYLGLLSSPGGRFKTESRQVEVSEFSRALKLMAKQLDVPILALSQLNRNPEQRADKKPMLSDLRESGSIEQDADVVVLLHREDAYDPDSERAGEADLIVAKQRNGPTGTVTVAFQGDYSRFVDMAPGIG